MLIAHLPAGFLWTRAVVRGTRKWTLNARERTWLLAVGLVASVLPDLDMLYFYFVDDRQHLHHSYWTHIPLFWTALFALPLALGWILRRRLWLIGFVIYSNIMLHLLLDTIAGKIRWAYPFSRKDFVFVDVTARYGWAYANFILHWTFLLEIGLVAFALVLVFKRSDDAGRDEVPESERRGVDHG